MSEEDRQVNYLLDRYCKIKLARKYVELQERINKAIEYMNNYIEVENAPINERIKTEFKEVIKLLLGSDKE